MPPSKYAQAIGYVANRTGVPLPSLLVSFAILHELTAIVPFTAFFYASRQFGAGQILVDYVRREDNQASDRGILDAATSKAREWADEGERWAGRVGRRYEIWGMTKRERDQDHVVIQGLAGDVANAVVAYGLTKVGICGLLLGVMYLTLFSLSSLLGLDYLSIFLPHFRVE